jgi:low temperature requirement protein LtrA
LPHVAGVVAFGVLALAEMLVPAWAERGGRGTSWHAQHISERYGLFTLIVLGECVAAATLAMQSATTSGLSAPQAGVAAGGLLLIFGLWWWYFEHPSEEGLRESRNSAFLWGYAHYAVFASVAALGAGLEVAAESTRRGSGVSPTTAGATVAISVAVYLVVTGAVQVRLNPTGVLKTRFVIPFAVLILIVGWSARAFSIGFALPVLGLIVVGLVLLDRLAPALHRTVDDPSTPALA